MKKMLVRTVIAVGFLCAFLYCHPPANEATPRALAPSSVRSYLEFFRSHPDSLQRQLARIPFADTGDVPVLLRQTFENVQAFAFPDSVVCIVFYNISDIGLMEVDEQSGRLIQYHLWNKSLMGVSGMIDDQRVFCKLMLSPSGRWEIDTFFIYFPGEGETSTVECKFEPKRTWDSDQSVESGYTFYACPDTTAGE